MPLSLHYTLRTKAPCERRYESASSSHDHSDSDNLQDDLEVHLKHPVTSTGWKFDLTFMQGFLQFLKKEEMRTAVEIQFLQMVPVSVDSMVIFHHSAAKGLKQTNYVEIGIKPSYRLLPVYGSAIYIGDLVNY